MIRVSELFAISRKKITAFYKQTLFINAGYIFGLSIFPSLIGFVFWSAASRLFSAIDVGLASAILSATFLLAGIANLGFSTAVIRLLPETEQPTRFLNTLYTTSSLISALLGVIYLLGLPLWAPDMKDFFQNKLFALGFVLYVVITTLGSILRDTHIAYRQAQTAFNYTAIAQILRLVLLFAFSTLRAAGLIAANLIAFAVALIYVWAQVPRVQAGYHPKLVMNASDLATTLPYALGNHFANLIWQFPQTILPVLIFEIVGAEANAYAYIALILGSLIYSPALALISSSFAECSNAPEQAKAVLNRVTKISLSVTLLLSAIVWLSAPLVLLIFGKGYSQNATILLRWLCIAAPFVTLNQIFFNTLRLRKEIKMLVFTSFALAIFTIGLSAVLLPRLGIAGSGIGILIGNMLTAMTLLSISLAKNNKMSD